MRVEAEDPRTGDTAHCCTAYLTFVAINDDQSQPVPLLTAEMSCQARAEAAQEAGTTVSR